MAVVHRILQRKGKTPWMSSVAWKKTSWIPWTAFFNEKRYPFYLLHGSMPCLAKLNEAMSYAVQGHLGQTGHSRGC